MLPLLRLCSFPSKIIFKRLLAIFVDYYKCRLRNFPPKYFSEPTIKLIDDYFFVLLQSRTKASMGDQPPPSEGFWAFGPQRVAGTYTGGGEEGRSPLVPSVFQRVIQNYTEGYIIINIGSLNWDYNGLHRGHVVAT